MGSSRRNWKKDQMISEDFMTDAEQREAARQFVNKRRDLQNTQRSAIIKSHFELVGGLIWLI